MLKGNLIDGLLQRLQPRAASFIVTVYGDVVVPRGEVLWMGSLIDICKRVGLGEIPVRTAVSRLVAAGRLEGERTGRRSFYRLASAARTEFVEAAELLYAKQVQPRRWLALYAPQIAQDVVRRTGMARLSGDVWLYPDWGREMPDVPMIMEVVAPFQAADADVLAAMWDLKGLQDRYGAMIENFVGLAEQISSGEAPHPDDAVIYRLLLVHAYRGVLLRDPCLPPTALPSDWLGFQARQLFSSLYLKLSPAADAQIGKTLEENDGLLPARTAETEARLRVLK